MTTKLWANERSLSGESASSCSSHAEGLPQFVHQLKWEVRHALATHLDPLKEPTGNDWRLLASRLGFKCHEIDLLQNKHSPTEELLKLCTSTTTQHLLEVLVGMGRMDAHETLVGGKSSFPELNQQYRCPLEESSASSLSFPLEDSGHGSELRSLGLPRVPSEQADEEFFSEESKEFWYSIPGKPDEKMWTDFSDALMRSFPEESQKGCIDKFICKVLKINYDDRNLSSVKLQDFLRLVAWFGPIRTGRDGCLRKINDLMKDSISRSRDGSRQSWFAGYMEEDEVEKRLREQAPGYFLIRFSISRADSGFFVLAVKVDGDVIQVQVENDVATGQLRLADQKFDNLGAIVREMRRNILLENCPQLLINPCPNLPLNAILKGYVGGGPKQTGRGRGRLQRS